MKTYWIMWTYIANHADRMTAIDGKTPEEALENFLRGYGPEFKEKGKFWVFEDAPALVMEKGKTV